MTERIAPPSLNIAAEQYERSGTEQFRNVLRLFFTRLTNTVNENVDNIDAFAYPTNTTDSSTARTISTGDNCNVLQFTNAAAVTVTVPQDSDANLRIGFRFRVMQVGAGTVTVVAGTGATLNVPTSAATSAQYGSIMVMKTAADTWTVMDN